MNKMELGEDEDLAGDAVDVAEFEAARTRGASHTHGSPTLGRPGGLCGSQSTTGVFSPGVLCRAHCEGCCFLLFDRIRNAVQNAGTLHCYVLNAVPNA